MRLRGPRTSGERAYYVREASQTVEAQGPLLLQLFEQAAKIPFDDRINRFMKLDDVSERLVSEYLADIGSEIGRTIPFSRDVYSSMQLISPLNGEAAPRNVALLFFINEPEGVFPGAKIEVVQFADDAGGNLIEEKTIQGPLHHQVRQTLNYLESLGSTVVEKVPGRAEVDRMVTYPHEAVREAVVNAVYHRSYEEVEPTKIYLYPDRMEITSYPGPVRGVELHHFAGSEAIPAVPARNRRIGGFPKELRLAESRGTGVPKIRRHMSESGSPDPRFDFDEGRTYFRVILPVHPRYRVIHALRESAWMWATGKRDEALNHLSRAAEDQPGSGAVTGQMIEYAAVLDDLELAKAYLEHFESVENRTEGSQPYLRYAAVLLNSFPTGRRPELACKKQRSILYAGSDGARGGRRVIGVTPCWARTRFRSLVPGLVTLTLVRSRTGIVRSRSSRSEEYLSFTPRRAIHPSRRRTAGRHQTAIQFLERSFLTWLFLRRSFLPARARRGHGRISGCFLGEARTRKRGSGFAVFRRLADTVIFSKPRF